jgi:hypothetical protein
MDINYQLSPYPTLVNEDMVVKIWEAESDGPSGEVYTEVIPEKDSGGVPTPGAGHQVINTVVATGLDNVVHIIRLYSSVSTNLLHEFYYQPRTDLATVFAPIRFKIGDGGPNTPAADTDTYQNDLLKTLTEDDYQVHRMQAGLLHPTTHYTIDSVAGTFQLNAPDVMADGEEFTVQRMPAVLTTVINDSVVGKWFGGFVNISASRDYLASDLRKLLRFTGAFNYTFPLASTIPIGYGFCFQRFGAAGIAKVKFDNGPLLWAGATKAEIDLPLYSEGMFVWDGTNWNVVYFIDSSFINAGALPPLAVVGAGNYNIGDVPGGDPSYEVTHNLDIPGDYLVILSIKSNSASTFFRNNKIGSTWWHHTVNKPNKFMFSLQEISGEVQDLSVSWLIIKL